MSFIWPELTILLGGQLLTKEVRRGLSATVIARVAVMGAVAALLYSAIAMIDGVFVTHVVIAASITLVFCHLVLYLPSLDYRIRGSLLIAGIFAAGFASEPQVCALFFGRSSLFLAIPAIMIPVVLRPSYTFVYWALVQVATVAVAFLEGHEYNVFPGLMLLVICVVAWLCTARADKVIDILNCAKKAAETERDEAGQAIEIISTAEKIRAREIYPCPNRETEPAQE